MKCAALYLHDIGAGTGSSVFNGASADIDNISPTGPQRPCKGIMEGRQYLKKRQAYSARKSCRVSAKKLKASPKNKRETHKFIILLGSDEYIKLLTGNYF